jgi:hypothetical protein
MPQSVPAFLDDLTHARKAEILRLRDIILAADPGLSERVKWNAPSFGYGEQDRITFRLQPADRVELIFHRGAKPRDSEGFAFQNAGGLLRFVAVDRAVLTFADAADVEAKASRLPELVRAWMLATAG